MNWHAKNCVKHLIQYDLTHGIMCNRKEIMLFVAVYNQHICWTSVCSKKNLQLQAMVLSAKNIRCSKLCVKTISAHSWIYVPPKMMCSSTNFWLNLFSKNNHVNVQKKKIKLKQCTWYLLLKKLSMLGIFDGADQSSESDTI